MLFSELYSAYYNTVAKLLEYAVKGELIEKILSETVRETAFGESTLSIIPAIRQERWQLFNADLTTPLTHIPTLPLTLLQKRWLKALLSDPRIRLFGIEAEGLDDVTPLFTPEDYCIYDRYSDGDDYGDRQYILNFRTVLGAIRDKKPLSVSMKNRRGVTVRLRVLPKRLEYSLKDDKFRLIGTGIKDTVAINLGRITKCGVCEAADCAFCAEGADKTQEITLILTDERNALERVMLHFAHFEKRAERIDTDTYRLTLTYDPNDESELVIRILSFGPMLKVIAPQRAVSLIKERLLQQKALNLK